MILPELLRSVLAALTNDDLLATGYQWSDSSSTHLKLQDHTVVSEKLAHVIDLIVYNDMEIPLFVVLCDFIDRECLHRCISVLYSLMVQRYDPFDKKEKKVIDEGGVLEGDGSRAYEHGEKEEGASNGPITVIGIRHSTTNLQHGSKGYLYLV